MVSPEDRNFDELIERFRKQIYGTVKGELRLELVRQDLYAHVPELHSGRPLRILDAGVGLGQFAIELAQRGHELVVCDISQAMLAELQTSLQQQAPEAQVTYVHAPLQNLADEYTGYFDIVLLHAVLEWLAEPQAGLQAIAPLLKPRGWLSTLFFNRNSVIFRQLLNGNFKKIRANDLSGWGKVLVPQHPLDPQEVLGWLQTLRLETICYTGIRTFTDYMPAELRNRKTLEELLDMEQHFARQEPFRSLGRYLHVLSRNAAT